MGHRTFWVLADHLSRNGIAVLRYDDRGVGKSEGLFDSSTSYDFAEDASSAISFLAQQSELSASKIGIIGHSEGGLIAPIVANINPAVDFIVLLAGPSRSGRFVSENQMRKILLSNGVSTETAEAGSSITKSLNDVVLNNVTLPRDQLAEKLLEAYATQWQQIPQSSKQQLQQLGGGSLPAQRIKMLGSPWYQAFLQHEPVKYLSKLTIPTYALYGSRDVQVSADDHAEVMRNALNHEKASKVDVLTDHNHLFQRSETGAMTEYQHIEETLSPVALSAINDWIHSLN